MAKKKKVLSKKHHFESNKFLLVLLIFLSFILVMTYANINFKKEKSYSHEEIILSVNSSTVTIPDTSFAVALTDGKADFSDSLVEGSVVVSDPFYTVKNGEVYDVFAVMTYNTGGFGEFVNVALFQVVKGKAVFRGSYPVGDRVVVNDITKSSGDYEDGYAIDVNYMDRTPDESMADEPTDFKTLTLEIKNHMIVTPETTEE